MRWEEIHDCFFTSFCTKIAVKTIWIFLSGKKYRYKNHVRTSHIVLFFLKKNLKCFLEKATVIFVSALPKKRDVS
ncbi:unnamed protein product [Blepharisma stoltei]|uniref:Uncharacterized protein n=1 Tax=Blepharisma stoltei TaxID=1481888 RepID=A0AAU9K9Q0_9CILI|nr:unnamed protein product [Blepharisma stoltei]